MSSNLSWDSEICAGGAFFTSRGAGSDERLGGFKTGGSSAWGRSVICGQEGTKTNPRSIRADEAN